MVSFAVGLGSFAQGMQQGMQVAQQVKGALDAKKIRKVEKEGAVAASAAREKDILSAIQATPNADGSTSYAVAGKPQASMEDARKAAEAQVGSVMDYYRSTTVPKLIEGYIDIGRPEQAEQLQSWIETQDANRLTKDWAKAARLAMIGDTGGAMKSFGRLYERMEPGSKYLGTEDITEPVYETRKLPKTGESIQVQTGTRPAGIRLKLRNADGEDVTHDFGGSEDLFNTAMFTLSPDKFAARALAQVDQATAARATAAKSDREFARDVGMKKLDATLDDQRDERQHRRTVQRNDREFAQQTQRDATQQGYDLEKIMTSKQMEAAMAPAIEAAKANGQTDEDARKAIGAIWKTLSENDLGGKGGFGSMSIEDQINQASKIYRQQSGAAKSIAGKGATQGNGRGVVPKLW